MIQVILQGIINSSIEFKQYEEVNNRASCNFKLKCLNTLQRNIIVDCYAYNSLATKIYSEYQKNDIVTCVATCDYKEETKIVFTLFIIEPSNITILPHKRTLYSDNYVEAEREYTMQDIKDYLKIK